MNWRITSTAHCVRVYCDMQPEQFADPHCQIRWDSMKMLLEHFLFVGQVVEFQQPDGMGLAAYAPDGRDFTINELVDINQTYRRYC
jgi:hypothetical protein